MKPQIDFELQLAQLNRMTELQTGIQDLMLLIGVERFTQISNQYLEHLLLAYQLQYVVLYKFLQELSQEPKEVKLPKIDWQIPFVGQSLN